MPFGLCNAPAVWARFIDTVLAQYRYDFVLTYADDILVYSSGTVEDHIEKLHKVFDERRVSADNVNKVKGTCSEMLGVYSLVRHFVEVELARLPETRIYFESFFAVCRILDLLLAAKQVSTGTVQYIFHRQLLVRSSLSGCVRQGLSCDKLSAKCGMC